MDIFTAKNDPPIKAFAEVCICTFATYTQVLSLNLFLNENISVKDIF